MKQIVFPVIVALVMGLCAPISAQLSADAAVAKAEAILKNLQDGKTADILKELDATVGKELTEARVKPVWSGLVAQFGAFKNINERREGQMQGKQAVELILAFEKETIVQRTVFDNEGKVAGLVFRPVAMAVLPANQK